MNKLLRKRIVDRHSDSLKRFGYHPNALYWSNREIQELRFKVLADVGVQSGDSVLDVGCGFADLNPWFEQQKISAHYTGIDISPDLIGVAKKKNPDSDLFVGELKNSGFKALSFDWVLLSGALNEPYNDKGKYARKTIKEMYRLCRKGVAFNLLNEQVVKAYDLQSFEPKIMLEYCEILSSNCELRIDYLENDFTIYMRKN
ncbi:MAG: class I SAM-dependent methyltransferase [Ghiorsea sp.]